MPGMPKISLGDKGAGDQRGEQRAQHGDDRDQRVLQRVADDHHALSARPLARAVRM